MSDSKLKTVNFMRHLGVVLDSSLNFAFKTLGFEEVLIVLDNSLVRSVLEYNSLEWSSKIKVLTKEKISKQVSPAPIF